MARHNPLDELSIEQQAVLADLASRIQRGDTEPSVTRREALAGAGALGAGALLGGVGATAATGSGAAQGQGTAGTSAAPLTKTWTHAIESGDGASQIDVPDTLAPDRVDTERIGPSKRYVYEDLSGTEFQAIIDELSTDEGGDGGYIFVDSSVTITIGAGAESNIWMKSDVFVDFGWCLVRYADGLDDDAPLSAPVSFENGSISGETNAVNAHVRNVEVDGNYQNNNFSDRRHRGGIYCLGWRTTDTGGRNFGDRPERCSIENVHCHDTEASNFLMGGEECEASNLWLEETNDDHNLYLPAPVDCEIETVWTGGTTADSRGNALAWGTTVSEDFRGTTVRGLRVRNSDIGSQWAINVRDPAGSTVNGNRLEDVSIHYDQPDGTRLAFQSPIIVDGLDFRGILADFSTGAIRFTDTASGSKFRDWDVTVTGVPSGSGTVAAIGTNGGGPWFFEDVKVEVTTADSVRAFFIRGSSSTVDGLQIHDWDIDVTDDGFRIAGSTNDATDLLIGHGRADVGDAVFDVSDTVTFGDGTMIPMDVRNVSGPREGRAGYHDGSGTNTSGPAFYDGSDWISQVDGSTIS